MFNGDERMRKLTESELKDVLSTNLPAVDQHREVVERVDLGKVRLRLPSGTSILVQMCGETPEALSTQGRW